MFTRVLVPLDGSPLAETALLPAKVLARRFRAELYLVRAEYPLAPGKEGALESLLLSQEATQGYLDIVAQQLTEEGTTTFALLPPTNPAEGIMAQAELDQVDLLVIAAHGRTGLDALLHPSATWQVLSRTTAPILVWKGASEGHARLSTTLPRFMTSAAVPILVPLDGSLQAEAALPLAVQLARCFDSPIPLVRVVAYPTVKVGDRVPMPFTEEMVQWSLAEAENYLKVQQAGLARQGLRVELEQTLGCPLACLEASVKKHHAGLVVLTSHGRGWFGRQVMGRVTKQLLSHLNVPILLVRPMSAVRSPEHYQAPVEVLEGWAQ